MSAKGSGSSSQDEASSIQRDDRSVRSSIVCLSFVISFTRRAFSTWLLPTALAMPARDSEDMRTKCRVLPKPAVTDRRAASSTGTKKSGLAKVGNEHIAITLQVALPVVRIIARRDAARQRSS